ncbi:uncharacterized protein BYT42DRAFT_77491 [Radiomyces spectabilis]|uniref:uncharacterized protein n=1 Tax=Radiomyces spectabilis TaxID=64574 RepID=UPI0022205D0D|nr:uncharacterized protein BYT42DRAFT_77407 [Radiomyces spectabilis]XP_051420685.1 uncharacterized protein BYT42DRAFT_77491 [Radiomyces spectabilis]KAI8371681.1 hypothetical protein BYT42DRAFT_77407 [Radiomyces spectabilis]KAI8371683.1 hypothetical protein BYT42DRAFT_77491 [Radiomyces spectabilis]
MKALQDSDLHQGRPDFAIKRYCGLQPVSNHGYGEAKAADQRYNIYYICMDLYRIGIFCRNATETQRSHRILAIQVIGFSVHFYILLQPAPTIYTMLKIGDLSIPRSLKELPALITRLPTMLTILDAFDEWCVDVNVAGSPTISSPTLSKETFSRTESGRAS